MAQAPGSTIQSPPQDDDDSLRKRLLKRVTIAGAVVVALLALFDGLYVRVEPSPKMATIVELPARTIETPAVEAATTEAKGDEKPDEPLDVAKETAAEPERTAGPTGTMPPAVRDERPLTMPATARPAMLRPAESAVGNQKPEPAREVARAVPAPVPFDQKPALTAGQFLLQMGVFSNVVNAEELRAKLELAGVPARIEARVQVGPFATRQAAEQAREKLKSLGMDPGLVMAARK